jgi:hypothetical protein
MGNTFPTTLSPEAYFAKLGATIITQTDTTYNLLYKTLQYTIVKNEGNYIISQKDGKVHSVKSLRQCGDIMKSSVAALLESVVIQATVWKADAGNREIRFALSNMVGPGRPLLQTLLTELFSMYSVSYSKTGQLVVIVPAIAIEVVQMRVKDAGIRVIWMDASRC